MSYSLVWEADSFNELNCLKKDLALRIIEKLESASENPQHYLIRLKGMPEYKLRIGDCHVILLLDNQTQQLKVQAVGHRKNIYKKYKSD